MRLLLDTHIILWLFGMPGVVPPRAMTLLEDRRNEILFSPVSLFEIVTKKQKGRSDFRADAIELHETLALHEVQELPLLAHHALAAGQLPQIHKDPFDRLLLAQAVASDAQLLTVDAVLLRYPSHVMDAR